MSNSDIATARRLTVGMNAAFAVAVIALVVGVVLEMGTVVLGTLGVFALVAVAYVAAHVVLHRRVSANSGANVTRDDSLGAALSLIRMNLLLYGGFLAAGAAVAFFLGYL
ncbi:hypothetical protein [Halomarina litorea]|uniref:hypothetical protein n=1 Tax=Halomarina litorea TaxID=2961595 RepID=UPI0020C47A21|nr:hypothetical protein [Halomarina sp. BCD28]